MNVEFLQASKIIYRTNEIFNTTLNGKATVQVQFNDI